MIRLSTLFCMVMIQLCCTAENAYARRGFPIPIFFGYGEEMVDIVELPSNVAPVVEAELGRAVKVAFVYERAHLFWLDLWTWKRFLVAKDQLISHGIDTRSAEVNLRAISDTILAKTNSQIDESFAVASNLDQQGELRSSSLIYSKLISTLPTDDERLAYAKTCLASIDERLRANVGKNE